MVSMRIRFLIWFAAVTPILPGQPGRPNHLELRALLVNHQRTFSPEHKWDSIFYHEDKLRSSLRSYLHDRKARENAQAVLALIGDPGDLQLVVRQAPPVARTPFANRWAYGVACALLEPSTE